MVYIVTYTNQNTSVEVLRFKFSKKLEFDDSYMFSAKFEYPILLNEACYIYYLTREAVQ